MSRGFGYNPPMTFLHISGYRFQDLASLEELEEKFRRAIREKADQLSLKGTVILSPEGINFSICGVKDSVQKFKDFLMSFLELSSIESRESWTHTVPFKRMLVKLKNRLLPLSTQSKESQAPYLSPEDLRTWIDEGRDFVLLDTRNEYEVRAGTFDHAKSLNLNHFRFFAEKLKELPSDYKDKPIVTFCTGGIRCEKAAPLMAEQGFHQVYQLQGGILNYFEKEGAKHFNGSCFVFDKRVFLDPHLNEQSETACIRCGTVLSAQFANETGFNDDRACNCKSNEEIARS